MVVDLVVVIVSWNVSSLLQDCLRSIVQMPSASLTREGLRLGSYGAEVWVVDNASSDGTPAMVRSEFPWVRVLANTENLGFAKANNLVLRQGVGRYALLLNPDTVVVEDAIVGLLTYMEQHEHVGVVGPQLLYGDGSLQSSRRRFPSLMTALWESTLLHQWFPNNPWARRYIMADTPDDQEQSVQWLNGACLMVRCEAIAAVGLLDEGYFMYSEELDWCKRIYDAGWAVVYFPKVRIIHLEGQSSGQVVAARHIRFQTSKVRYFYKHHGRLTAEFLRVFILLTYWVQLAEEALKYLVGHKRGLRRERMAAYSQVLKSRLRLANELREGAS